MSSLRTRVRALLSSDTIRAAGMGLAVVGVNVVTLLFTIVFARLLGTGEYGELGALTAALLTLLIPGSALQITVARRISLGSEGGRGVENIRTTTHHVALASLPIATAALALREPTAQLIGVDAEWAAGAIVPTACLGLLVSMQRGALQGEGRYRVVGGSLVGEALGRLVFGFGLYAAGLGVTGVFLGSAVSLLATGVVLDLVLERSEGAGGNGAARFKDLVLETWAPLLSLSLIALMQNIDLIVVKHNASSHAAGIYAAASLTAKVIVWIAVGLGYYLLPEAARRWGLGEDTRRLVVPIFALLAAVSAPVIALDAVAGRQLLTAVFGSSYAPGSEFLTWLALAMTALAFTYLSVQHLLARGRATFIVLLAAAATIEPFLLSSFGADLKQVAIGQLALQVPLAALMIGIDFLTAAPQTAAPPPLATASPAVMTDPAPFVDHGRPSAVPGPPEKTDIAVVIPCFNHGRYLGEAVGSALSQTLPPAKIVVVDDGSDEPGIEEALAALPGEVEVIRQRNRGRGAARNAGAAAAPEADFVLMLDADDLLPENSIATLHGALAANPKAGFAFGRMRYFGDWSGEVRLPPFDPYAILYRPTTGWIGMLRREAFDGYGGYETSLEGYEDWDLVLGILEAGWEAAQVDDVVLEYRKHGQSSLAGDRDIHRRLYRTLRRRHRELFSRAPELARQSSLSAPQRVIYRAFWAWRPVPARVERAVYSRLFRAGAEG